jgi:hypothetical protein
MSHPIVTQRLSAAAKHHYNYQKGDKVIRIHNSIGRSLFFVLNWIKRSPERFAEWERGDFRDDIDMFQQAGMQAEELQCLINGGDFIEPSLEDTYAALQDALQGSTTRPVEIIEQLTELIQLPTAKSILAGDTLQALRKLLLRPDQFVALQRQLNATPLCCTYCGHPFQGPNEMASISGRSIACSTCAVPNTVACSVNGCKSYAGANTKLREALRFKGRCYEHKEGLAEKLNRTDVPDQAKHHEPAVIARPRNGRIPPPAPRAYGAQVRTPAAAWRGIIENLPLDIETPDEY